MAYQSLVRVNKRYELVDLIGSGTMGSVYQAVDHLTGQTVALKQLPDATPDQESDFRLALAREFTILASLRHPHIISVQDYGFDEQQQPFFTMEYLPQAQNILAYAQDKSPKEKIQLLIQLLLALSYLHRCGVLHRDLKPGNVMVTDAQVKVLDFGLASQRDTEKVSDQVAGTVIYMAPEVIQGMLASAASDLYAVGVLAFELLEGRHPFSTLMEILEAPPATDGISIDGRLLTVILRLLQKKPEDRYPDAEATLNELAAASGYELPPENRAIQSSFLEAAKFVGRAAEVQQLMGALTQAMEGHGSAWLIGGESGVGKSRLTAELGIRALVKGALVLRGRAIAESGAPYHTWHPVLRRLCLHTELSDFEAGVLKPFIPDIDRLINRSVPDAAAIDPTAVQNRLLRVIEAIFARQTKPIVLLLGDMQWGGESLVVLDMLSRLAKSLPLLIVANFRDDERPRLPDKLPNMHLMRLGGLERDAILQLSQSMLGESEQQQEIVDLLERVTEGNAFFIVEVIRALAEQAGQLSQIGSMPLPASLLPDGMKQVLERRLGFVPEHARELLYAAAVAGRDIDIDLLQAIEPGVKISYWLALVSPVLEVRDNRYRFAHDKFREQLLGELGDSQRRLLHRRVAAAIEATYPDDSRYHQVLAGHYYVAGEELSEARYAILAAQEALKNGLFREAVFYLDRVLKLPIESEQKVIVIGTLSTAYFGLGDFQSSRAAAENGLRLLGVRIPRSALALALDLLREAVKQLLLRLLRGRWIFRRRHFDEAAIQKISTLLLHLGYIYEFECEKLFALCNTLKAINLVEIERIRSLRAVSYYFAAILYQARPLSALGMADRYVTLAEDALTSGQDHEHYGHALLVKAAYASMQGEWEAAMQTVTQARSFFSDRGAVRDVDNMLGLRAHCEFLMGEWDSCYSDAAFVYESAQKRNDLQAALGSLMWMLSHWIRRGDREQMRAVMDQAPPYLQRSHSRSMVIWSGAMLGLAHYQLGNIDAARQAADPALKIVQRKSPISSWLHEPFSALAELYLNFWQDGDRGSRASAKIACKALMNLGSVYRVSLPCAHIWQGRFHFLDGDLRRAAHCWQQALVTARQYRTPFYEGLAYHYLAQQPFDDPDEQQRHLEAAKQIFERLSADGTWNPIL